MRKAYLNCRKRQSPPGIEVLNFSFFRFILDYKHQNNLFQYKTSYIEALRETESDLSTFFLYTLYKVECFIGILGTDKTDFLTCEIMYDNFTCS